MKQTLSDIPEVRPGRDVTRFGEDSFWKERYANGTVSFEWFVPFSDVTQQNQPFRGLLQSRVASKAKVVEIGCGTSELCENLWDMGFRDVTGLDNQPAAIEFCNKRQGTERQIKYVVGDMTKMPFEDKSVDVIIDKGALDALVCHGGDGLAKCGAEMWRTMKPNNSLLIVMSNAPLMEIPDGLKPWFEKQEMTMVKNLAMGQLMAKLYLFSRRKKRLQ